MIRIIKPKTTLKAKTGSRTIIIFDSMKKRIKRARIPQKLYVLLPQEISAKDINELEKMLADVWKDIDEDLVRRYITRIIEAYKEISLELEGKIRLSIVKLADLSVEDQNDLFENYIIFRTTKKSLRVMILHRYFDEALVIEGPIGFLEEYEKYLPIQLESETALLKAQKILKSHRVMSELDREQSRITTIIEEIIMLQTLISRLASSS